MSETLRWPPKDPDEDLDYEIDWTDRLRSLPAAANDTISGTPSWSVSGSGLAIGTGGKAPTATETSTKVWLSGGTAGQVYDVTCRITTTGGRTMELTYKLLVRSSAEG
ncbi:MAG TPA: hypothetical protein VJ890_14970 [Vineibacter sp.]|nr:hypothetical protein [Vineibacter sp.]